MYKPIRSFFKHCATFVAICFAASTMALTSYVPSAQAAVIYQAFDMCYQNIKADLSKLKDEGYTYIQVSPPQTTPERKSNPCQGDDEWWLQYQPINYEIGNTLGSESDLRDLIEAAHKKDMKVLVDVVLNHVADEKTYEELLDSQELHNKVGKPIFPLKEKTGEYSQYFHPKDGLCDNDRYKVTHGWLGLENCSGELKKVTSEALPDLNTESPEVREKGKKYVEKLLIDLKADGLRFDTLKHIEPEYFEYILKDIPHNKFDDQIRNREDLKYIYGEIIDGNPHAKYIYDEYIHKINGMDITDYPLEIKMVKAFRYGGDLRSLINPEKLQPLNAVTFARTHDTAFDPQRKRDLCEFPEQSDLCFDDSGDGKNEKDTFLGYAYVLSLQEGFPLIYRYDAENPTVLAGVKFHETMMDQPQYFRNGDEIAQGANSPNLLFVERGDKGIVMINKSAEYFDAKAAKMPALEVGCYNELQHDFKMCVGKGDDGQKYITQWGSSERGGIQIGPRTALFFVKEGLR